MSRSAPDPGHAARSDVAPVVEIRDMCPGEGAEVGALTLAAYDRYGHITGRYRRFLGDPDRRVDGCTALLVATWQPHPEAAPQLAGTVTYVTPGDTEWEHTVPPAGDAGFRILAVAPQLEGHGIGTRLVATCIERARDEGRRRLLLTSMAWMTRAHVLYEQRFGFVRRPDLDRTFPAGVGFVYALDLVDDAAAHFPPPGPVPDEPPWFEDVPRR